MGRPLSVLTVAGALMMGLPVMAQTVVTSPPYTTSAAPPGGPVYEPAPAPAPSYAPPVVQQTAPVYAQTPIQTLYAVKEAHIRSGPSTSYAIIGKIPLGHAVQITGGVPGNPKWVQLTTGGYVSASILSPTPVVVEHHHHHHEAVYVEPPKVDYPVGSCQPYTRVVEVGGVPKQVNGTACKQPDGTWKIVTNDPHTPVVVQQPPVVVQQPVPPAYLPGPNPYYR